MSDRRPRVVVVGSINMDLVVRCPVLPIAGQTVAASSATEICGGKGANQAVAAAKVGGEVMMVGRVGSDAFAERLVNNLNMQNIDHQRVLQTPNCTSGVAIVSVEDSGENAILLVGGSNAQVTNDDVSDASSLIQSADVLLLQLEIPTPAVLTAIEVARRAKVRCILDPAPVAADWTDELLNVDLLCPNETEASKIVGRDIESIDDAVSATQSLCNRGVKNVALTMGHQGTVLNVAGEISHVPAVDVDAVDTTAAGDAFAGALAVRWAETNDLESSVRFANVAGALAATRHGAQPSLASRDEIESHRSYG